MITKHFYFYQKEIDTIMFNIYKIFKNNLKVIYVFYFFKIVKKIVSQ